MGAGDEYVGADINLPFSYGNHLQGYLFAGVSSHQGADSESAQFFPSLSTEEYTTHIPSVAGEFNHLA